MRSVTRYLIEDVSQEFLDQLYERTEPVDQWVEEKEDGTGRRVYRLITVSNWMVPFSG